MARHDQDGVDTGTVNKQEAQLPQRNSASAVHVYLGWLTLTVLIVQCTEHRIIAEVVLFLTFKLSNSDSRSASRKRILS